MAEILIGEDNPADVYLIRIALQEYKIDLPLRVAVDGQELLRIVEEEERAGQTQVTLIILDINLPRHDGFEVLRRLRRSGPLSGVPVAVLTSSDSPRDRLATSDLGAARFLQKPSSLDEFLRLGAVFKELLAEVQPANRS